MVRIGPMASPKFPLDRRELMAGLGAAALAPIWPAAGRPRPDPRWRCKPKPRASPSARTPRPRRSGRCKGPNSLQARRDPRNRLRQRTAGARRPQLARDRWRPGGRTADGPASARGWRQGALQLPLRHAGTFLCDLELLGDGQAQPSRARALIVQESEAVAVDRDEVLLIEDWRVRPDGTAIAPGDRPRGTPCQSIRLTARLRSISQPEPTNGSGSASSVAANALLLQSKWRDSMFA